MMKRILSVSVIILTFACYASFGQNGYKFSDVNINQVSQVKDQASSGTCWSFACVALLESELMKNGQGELDLSEMWIVRNTYFEKVINYVRYHGNNNLSPGGVGSDIPLVLEKYGIVPEEVYPGLNYGTDTHRHGELDEAIKNYADAIVRNPNRTLSKAWIEGLNGILDAYLGKVPETFNYKGREYTPQSFARELGLKASDLIQVSSFTHHPFYETFVLEVPDNWSHASVDNVPMEELERIIDNALEKGRTIGWAADVSEEGFVYNKGFSVVPAMKITQAVGSDQARWARISEEELKKLSGDLTGPVPEMAISQQIRQEGFDNYRTTDDHLMQIVGTAKDQNGTKFYKVKNSWGQSGVYNGFFYTSVPYVLYKTTALLINKNTLPADIALKLGVK